MDEKPEQILFFCRKLREKEKTKIIILCICKSNRKREKEFQLSRTISKLRETAVENPLTAQIYCVKYNCIKYKCANRKGFDINEDK